MRHALFVLVLAVGAGAPVAAQLPQPAGVVALATTPAPVTLTWQRAAVAPKATARGLWTWIGYGALIGAAVGAMAGALAVNTDEENFIPPAVFVGAGAVVGAAGGGLIGALAYAGSHSPSSSNEAPPR